MEKIIFTNLPTLGIRSFQVERTALQRKFKKISTPWGEVRIKEAVVEGKVVHAWPEYEDLKIIARKARLGITQAREEIMKRYGESVSS